MFNTWITALDEQQRKEIVGHETEVSAMKEIAKGRRALQAELAESRAESKKKKKQEEADDDEQQGNRPPKDPK